jgi:hypothetical protein
MGKSGAEAEGAAHKGTATAAARQGGKGRRALICTQDSQSLVAPDYDPASRSTISTLVVDS